MRFKRLLICVAVAGTFVGCGKQGEVKEIQTTFSSSDSDYYYEEEMGSDADTDIDKITYTIKLQGGDKATLTEATVFDENYTSITQYGGTYSMEGDVLKFSYVDADMPDGEPLVFEFRLESDKIVERLEDQASMNPTDLDFSGTYTDQTRLLGEATMEVGADGAATVKLASGETYTGTIWAYDGEDGAYEVMGSTDDGSKSLDWVVRFDGDSYTAENWFEKVNGNHEGTYTATGELGTIDFKLDNAGNVSCSVEYQGQTLNMSGSYYLETDSGQEVYWVNVSDEAGYSLDVQLVDIGGGELNYSGTISIPLAAG